MFVSLLATVVSVKNVRQAYLTKRPLWFFRSLELIPLNEELRVYHHNSPYQGDGEDVENQGPGYFWPRPVRLRLRLRIGCSPSRFTCDWNWSPYPPPSSFSLVLKYSEKVVVYAKKWCGVITEEYRDVRCDHEIDEDEGETMARSVKFDVGEECHACTDIAQRHRAESVVWFSEHGED